MGTAEPTGRESSCMSCGSELPEKLASQNAVRVNVDGSIAMTFTRGAPGERLPGIATTFVSASGRPAGGRTSPGPCVAATSAPTDTIVLSNAADRTVATTVPAYARMPTASVDAVTSRRATRGADASRRNDR